VDQLFAFSRAALAAVALSTLMSGCGKPAAQPAGGGMPPPEVNVVEVAPQALPVSFEYVGQTQSSHQVQIRARVNGFLDKRVYTEGAMVKAGDVMFQQDKKPFIAQLDIAKGGLAEQKRDRPDHGAATAGTPLYGTNAEPSGAVLILRPPR